ncbi:hypothetical protein TNCV_2314931 [Trichonephila clavipes]|nr:hypothetical protein TNCV_2314931 [Trichonephila clavipes]
MAPESRWMSGNTCGSRMSWRYRWAVMVPRINTRVETMYCSFLVRGTTPNGGVDGWESRAAHVMGASEGATCSWMTVDEAVVYACISYDVSVFSTTGLSSSS